MECIQGSTHITKDDIESVFALYDRVSPLLFFLNIRQENTQNERNSI